MDTLKHQGAFIFVIFASSFQLLHKHYIACRIARCQKPKTSSSGCEFLKAENFSKNRKQQLKGGTQFELNKERGSWFSKMSLMYGSIRLVTTPWATTGTSPALRAWGWGVVWSGDVPDFRGYLAGQIENNFSLFLWSTSLLAWLTRWRRTP